MIEWFFKTFSEWLLNSQSDMHIYSIDFMPVSELKYLQGLIDHAWESARSFEIDIEGFDKALIEPLTKKFIADIQMNKIV